MEVDILKIEFKDNDGGDTIHWNSGRNFNDIYRKIINHFEALIHMRALLFKREENNYSKILFLTSYIS